MTNSESEQSTIAGVIDRECDVEASEVGDLLGRLTRELQAPQTDLDTDELTRLIGGIVSLFENMDDDLDQTAVAGLIGSLVQLLEQLQITVDELLEAATEHPQKPVKTINQLRRLEASLEQYETTVRLDPGIVADSEKRDAHLHKAIQRIGELLDERDDESQ